MDIKLLVIGLVLVLIGCQPPSNKRFELLNSKKTGIDFVNELKPSPELNIFNYLYYFNGAGVAAGDFNGDDLPDLYFTSNQGQDKLYLNQGDFKFRDITSVLHESDRFDCWKTGVTVADVNADGKLDIYVSEVGSYLQIYGVNSLYINQGNDEEGVPQFREMAKKYGLDLVGFSTQAAFFDYDLDGDLDMYQLNHSVHSNGTFVKSDLRYEEHPLAGDRLMRNDNGVYHDVTKEAGIYSSALGYGLGLAITDINEDGWPDIYVGNDFHENDYFYINQGDGTFVENLENMMQHTSRFSMGNDVADINNDGLLDIISLDMLPRDYQKLKASAGEEKFDVFRYKLRYGYNHQYARNTLQLNRGNNKFSEIGLLANVHATDWSWASLFADLDLDGNQDLFIANGIKGRTNDSDYIKFVSNDAIQYRLEGDMTSEELKLTNKMPEVLIPNYAFQNQGDLKFEDVSEDWGLNKETFSNGAIYADLDADGDLDLVINNINQEALIYKNMTLERDSDKSFLRIKFSGIGENKMGIGAVVKVYHQGQVFIKENYNTRGFQSAIAPELHFGVGDKVERIDSIQVYWPAKGVKTYYDVEADQLLALEESDWDNAKPIEIKQSNSILEDEAADLGFQVSHRENSFVDFSREGLMPHMVSREGPALAVADVNNDGLEDVFIGGAKHQNAYLYLQNQNGTFQKHLFPEDSIYEDIDAFFMDVDSDGSQDLIVLSGGNEFRGKSPYRQPRLYLNKNNGEFRRKEDAFAGVYMTGATIAAADYDGDGDLDLFLGARAEPWAYGDSPRSYLLLNDDGNFKKDDRLPTKLGMITQAKWADLDGNGFPDLVCAKEWGGFTIIYFHNDEFKIQEFASGLWSAVFLSDLDFDGRVDIIAGNLGLNSKFKASESDPIRMYINDFDQNDYREQLVTYSEKGKEYLFADKDALVERLTVLKKRYLDYTSFSHADFHEVFVDELLAQSDTLQVTELKSCVFWNKPEGFEQEYLPIKAQFAPLHAVAEFDLLDNYRAIFLGGNFSGATIQRGRYDASYGDVLLVSPSGHIDYVENAISKLYMTGDVKAMRILLVKGEPKLIVARNNSTLACFDLNALKENLAGLKTQ